VLGDKISLDTIDGTKILVTIPEHSEVGSNLRIPSKGLNILKGSGRGDIM
jgi:DnaJ-class molecular chaperone